MSEHTPGPWHVYEGCVYDADNAELSHCPGEADARLIAAAPDLLAALKALLDNGDDPHPLSGRDPTVRREDIGPARAAIAKAIGEQETSASL
jgi:hypothetical protein